MIQRLVTEFTGKSEWPVHAGNQSLITYTDIFMETSITFEQVQQKMDIMKPKSKLYIRFKLYLDIWWYKENKTFFYQEKSMDASN